jgi:hypothetical protein
MHCVGKILNFLNIKLNGTDSYHCSLNSYTNEINVSEVHAASIFRVDGGSMCLRNIGKSANILIVQRSKSRVSIKNESTNPIKLK